MLIFETGNNKYVFDNFTGCIVPYDNEIVEKNSTEDIRKLNNSHLIRKYQEYGLFQDFFELRKDRKIESTMKQEIIAGWNNLELVLTQACNFRCKYCMYGEHYPYHLNHDDSHMSLDTAKKAIDIFLSYRDKSIDTPSITFYGGEPLIDYSKIKWIVNYAKKVREDFKFNITTNASLLNNEIIDFFILNNFNVAISLDGSKTNNDRNRIFNDGNGTFDIVWEKIVLLKEMDLNKSIKLSILCCVDEYTSLIELADFFDENMGTLGDCEIRINGINRFETTFFDDVSMKCDTGDTIKKVNHQEEIEELRKRFENNYYGKNRFKLFSPFIYDEIATILLNSIPHRTKMNNSCLPGSKITVSPNGEIVVCENTLGNHFIGDVNNGISEKGIKGLIDSMSRLVNNCNKKRCPIRRVCSLCYAYVDSNLKIKQGFCEAEINNKRRLIRKICSNLEKDRNYYRNIME